MSRVAGPLTEGEIRRWRAYFAEPPRKSWADERVEMAAEYAESIADAYEIHLRPPRSRAWHEAAERMRVNRRRCTRMIQAIEDGVTTEEFRERFGCSTVTGREACARIGLVMPLADSLGRKRSVGAR